MDESRDEFQMGALFEGCLNGKMGNIYGEFVRDKIIIPGRAGTCNLGMSISTLQ